MKLHHLLAALFCATLLAASAQAAEEKKSDAAPAADAQKDAKPKVKPHSHMTEKGMGGPAASSDVKSDKKALHNHAKEHKQQ